MTSKSNSLKISNLNIDSSIKEEENLIKSLIEEIYKAEEKISEINYAEENLPNGLNIKNQKLYELKALKNNLEQKLILLKNNYQRDIISNKNKILLQQNALKDIDISIKEYQSKLSNFNIENFTSPLLVLENDFDIGKKVLSQEQINDIYMKTQNRNENDLKQLKRDIEINNASESFIINNKKEINKKLEQINENLKMLKEEKISINDELINIISYKESLECIHKNHILNIMRGLESKNLKLLKNQTDEVKLYLYELNIIEPKIAANKIFEELSYAFRIIGSYNKKNNFNYAANDINNINSSKNKTNINFYQAKKKDMNTIDLSENKKYSNDSHNSNYRNKSLNNSCIAEFKDKDLIFDKNSLKELIRKELVNFIKNIKNYSSYNNNEIFELINNLLNSVSLKIIENNDIKIVNCNNLQSYLILYLKYLFKILYYEKITENNFKFVNKEYKAQKKENKKIKEIINNELLKLENKHDEIKTKKIYDENQLTILNNSNNNYLSLSPTEQSYIQICAKINSLIKKKDEILNNINNFEIDINCKKVQNEKEIENINTELEKIKKDIKDINNKKESNTLKNNEDIIKYRKIIADKFNAIKQQLQLYKQKYGSNLSLYNKFINNINNTIQKSCNNIWKNESLLLFEDTEHNDDDIIINGAENKNIKKNDKYINLNMIANFKGLNSLNNNIKNSKIFNTNRVHENSFNKSLNKNNEKEVNKILNKTITNLRKSSDNNLSSNELFLDEKKNYKFINNIKVEKINKSFYQYSSLSNTNKNSKKEDRKNDFFNFNSLKDNLLEEEKKMDKNIAERNIDISSKTFSHPFFRKQSKSQGGIPESGPFPNKTRTTKNTILNINLFRNKKLSSKSGVIKGIPKSSKILNEQSTKPSIKNIKIRLEKNSIDNNKNFLYKLNSLTKITFCYYREIPVSIGNFVKYNPLKKISSKELCEYPYNFIKSTISLNKNYKNIKIVPSTQLEPIDIKLSQIENTVVNSAVKSIIEIHRNYYKWKENNKGNDIINDFINEQIKKYDNLNQEDVEKCIVNKNFNFSLIINNFNKDNNSKRIEFIICSYDEFKMWINGMAFIIKNKNYILKLINESKA